MVIATLAIGILLIVSAGLVARYFEYQWLSNAISNMRPPSGTYPIGDEGNRYLTLGLSDSDDLSWYAKGFIAKDRRVVFYSKKIDAFRAEKIADLKRHDAFRIRVDYKSLVYETSSLLRLFFYLDIGFIRFVEKYLKQKRKLQKRLASRHKIKFDQYDILSFACNSVTSKSNAVFSIYDYLEHKYGESIYHDVTKYLKIKNHVKFIADGFVETGEFAPFKAGDSKYRIKAIALAKLQQFEAERKQLREHTLITFLTGVLAFSALYEVFIQLF